MINRDGIRHFSNCSDLMPRLLKQTRLLLRKEPFFFLFRLFFPAMHLMSCIMTKWGSKGSGRNRLTSFRIQLTLTITFINRTTGTFFNQILFDKERILPASDVVRTFSPSHNSICQKIGSTCSYRQLKSVMANSGLTDQVGSFIGKK